MNRLFVDALKSVGLVAAGDDPEATVTFWKAKPDSEVTSMSDKAESQPAKPEDVMDLSAIEDQDLRKTIEETIAEKDSQIEALTAEVEKQNPPDPVEDASDELKDLIAKERSEREELQKKLDDAVEKQRIAEYVAKAEPLEILLGKAEDVGPVLADLAEKAPDSYEKLESALVAASQRDELSKLFATLGTSDEGSADAEDRRDAYVAKAKGDGSDKTDAELRAEFWQTPEGRTLKKEMRS